jgi:hypothetical protein
MKQSIFYSLIFLIIATTFNACSKEGEEEINPEIREGTGTIWLSGGLAFCAEQIRMENGDTLIPVSYEEVYKFESGQLVNIKFIEKETRESSCSVGKDCEIIEISLAE